jgi:hypothetical protein
MSVVCHSCPQIQILNDHQFNPTIQLTTPLPMQISSSSSYAMSQAFPAAAPQGPAYIYNFDHSSYLLPLKPVSLSAAGNLKSGQYSRRYGKERSGSSVSGSVNGDYPVSPYRNNQRGYDNRYMSDTASQASQMGGSSHRSNSKKMMMQMGNANLTTIGGPNSRPYSSSRSSSFSDQQQQQYAQSPMMPSSEHLQQPYIDPSAMYVTPGADPSTVYVTTSSGNTYSYMAAPYSATSPALTSAQMAGMQIPVIQLPSPTSAGNIQQNIQSMPYQTYASPTQMSQQQQQMYYYQQQMQQQQQHQHSSPPDS